MKKTNPELDLLIMEALGTEFKPVSDISEEVQVEETVVTEILDELARQGLAIDKKGTSYRMIFDEEDV
jgi:Mn-dependent DtxR family transcriptional regulator